MQYRVAEWAWWVDTRAFDFDFAIWLTSLSIISLTKYTH